MPDAAPEPKVSISLADAKRLRDEMRSINNTLNHMVGAMIRSPFKAPDITNTTQQMDELIDRLTVAIHEATKT